MGSGDRFSFGRADGFGIGIYVSRFPFSVTIGMQFAVWNLTLGFGRAYDDPR